MTSVVRTLRCGIAAIALVGALGVAQAWAQEAQQTAPSAMPADSTATAMPADAAATEAPAAMEAAPADAVPVEGNEDMVEVTNPYGLEALWAQGDFVAKGTLIILIIMSMGSWFILLTRLWDQQVVFNHAKTATNGFWNASNLKDGLVKLEKNSAFRVIVEEGLKAAEHHEGKLTDQIALTDWVTMSLQRSTNDVASALQKGLAFLAAVASSAPFVGLFGTVWGIYHALVAIGIAGQASIDKVAGPVGEALIMTAIGLAVAVPAVLGYNWLVSRNKVVLETVRNFAADVHAVLLSGNKKVARS